MQAVTKPNVVIGGSSQSTGYAIQKISDDLSWGVGAIQPDPALSDNQSQQALTQVVQDSLSIVNPSEQAYSSCTDGRVPMCLNNGESVPVREQIVGADTMLIFHMAEVLGPRFYKDPNAPLQERLQFVADFMKENGLVACTHVACGAAGSYVAIVKNLVDFTANQRFTDRQKQLLPQGIYSDDLRTQITEGYKQRLAGGLYEGWSDALVTDAVKKFGDGRTIAELSDDGRGVHGHVEEQIIRIKAPSVATNELQIIARTGGREVFAVSDTRMQRLAQLMGRGQDNDYRMALMAAEDFTDGGHGTLAKNLPTYVVTAA